MHYKKRRIIGRHFITRGFFLFLLLITAVYFFIHSQFFNVSHIEVAADSQSLLTEEEIKNLSGIRTGSNIFQVDARAAEKKLELHPMIKKSAVGRVLPKTIKIQIEERRPAALIPVDEGFIQICHDGFYLKHMDTIGGVGHPIITGLDLEGIPSPGDKLTGDGLELALKSIGSLPSDGVNIIGEVDAHNPSNIRMYTVTGVEIILGDQKDLQDKIRLALDIISGLDKNIRMVDVRFLKTPVVK
ncbi:MAG: FtsQ-type POTRA domain-containing protein [Clostridia bacterium]|nr:FtsQ-type POTRA domain-containing protein [Clostridia bacterium]